MNDEKVCALCGKPLSRYGNKKIKDGTLCRNCIKPASPWLSDDDYLKMDLDAYRKHLEYRLENLKKLEDFKGEKSVEGKYSLYLDDANKLFAISKRKDLKKENADVISLDDVKEISIFEEGYPDSEDVDICFDLKLANEQIDNICFRVNEFPGLIKGGEEHQAAIDLAMSYLNAFEAEDGLDFEQVEGE
ncbi:MAG: DUF4428 domain-containing protein [Erysipelotrichaceae bacterium]|nr:DUF4428 domain-containing protein [Erysipelotrichaceae bacterium]